MRSGRQSGSGAVRRAAVRGFSLLDVMVTISVIAVLIAMLMPALGRVRETAHRVICSSNVRQMGLGMAMFADANGDLLPPSRFVLPGPDSQRPQDMIWLRGGADSTRSGATQWDGLGVLYASEYLGAPGVFYCPSHSGSHPFSAYSAAWGSDYGDIAGNYQFRGKGPNGSRLLHKISNHAGIVTDGLRTQADFNHRVGANVLRADLSVYFFWDPEGELLSTLPRVDGEVQAEPITAAWKLIDGDN